MPLFDQLLQQLEPLAKASLRNQDLAVFLLAPLVAVFVQAFADGAAVYWKAVTEPDAASAIRRS